MKSIKINLLLPLIFTISSLYAQDPIYVSDRLGSSMTTNRNINHPKGINYQDLKRSVAFIVVPKTKSDNLGLEYCSGTLLNTLNNGVSKNYFILTAEHCLNGRDENYPLLYSFNYEIAHATRRANEQADEKISVVKLLPAQKVYDNYGADIALLKIDFNALNEDQKLNLKNVYGVGYNLHPSAGKENYINISHPMGDHKKLFTNPNGQNFVYNHYSSSGYPQGFRFRAFGTNWDNTKSVMESGSSGSSFFDISDNHHTTAGVYIAGKGAQFPPKTTELISFLENSWTTSSNDGLQSFLDPDNTWISKIEGGYLSESIPNQPVDFDINFNAQGAFTKDLDINLANYFAFDLIGINNEKLLGNGLLSNLISDDIYLTITQKNDLDYLLYGITYDQISSSPHDFNGSYWEVDNPPSASLPDGTSSVFSILNSFFYSKRRSDNMEQHIQNYLIQKITDKSNSINAVEKFREYIKTNNSNLSVKVSLSILNNSLSNTTIRAIKFPRSMPFNAAELFDPTRFSDFWSFNGYPDSRSANSTNLYINDISGNVSGNIKTTSSGNNGGYLNMVNPLQTLGTLVSSTPDSPSLLHFTGNVTNNLGGNFYYKVWVDFIPNVDANNQYNFVDDQSPNAIELIAEGQSSEDAVQFQYIMPTANQLGLNAGEEKYYRLRFAVSNHDNKDHYKLISMI